MQVQIPQGCQPGSVFQVQAPTGELMSVSVPPGGGAGMMMQGTFFLFVFTTFLKEVSLLTSHETNTYVLFLVSLYIVHSTFCGALINCFSFFFLSLFLSRRLLCCVFFVATLNWCKSLCRNNPSSSRWRLKLSRSKNLSPSQFLLE